MSIIVKTNIKEYAGDLNVSSDFAVELDKKVQEMIKVACTRAEANNRRTVMAKDI